MTEQPPTPDRSDDRAREREREAGGAADPARPGGGRTHGETAVDDALGSGPDRPE
jgi:hypothetical protein